MSKRIIIRTKNTTLPSGITGTHGRQHKSVVYSSLSVRKRHPISFRHLQAVEIFTPLALPTIPLPSFTLTSLTLPRQMPFFQFAFHETCPSQTLALPKFSQNCRLIKKN